MQDESLFHRFAIPLPRMRGRLLWGPCRWGLAVAEMLLHVVRIRIIPLGLILYLGCRAIEVVDRVLIRIAYSCNPHACPGALVGIVQRDAAGV